MSRERSRPSDVILDMLRSARSRRRSAQSLIAAGALFGFPENTVRVTLSRLMARGMIESPGRGLYRLASTTDALNDFVERWRLGERRVRRWTTGDWLFVHHSGASTGPDRNGERHSQSLWALDALGFRPVRPDLLARPDNLTLSVPELRTLALRIGLGPDALFVRGRPEGESEATAWSDHWQPQQLDADYRQALMRLAASAARLPEMPLEAACMECFTLGGEMIHRLAKDPLLPGDWVDVDARRQLSQCMLDYDAQGKAIWDRGKQGAMRHMPHPQLAQAF